MLKAVGFKKLEFYRNFNFEDYDKNGTDLIITAEKKGVLKSDQRRRSVTETRYAKAKAEASKSVSKRGVTVSRPRGRPPKYQGR
jgi:lipopolysaccharide export LptBFGC system permease protein LptF